VYGIGEVTWWDKVNRILCVKIVDSYVEVIHNQPQHRQEELLANIINWRDVMTTFTKDMLRTGMRVKYNNDQTAMVLKDIGILAMDGGFNFLSHLDDDIQDKDNNDNTEWSIDSVYEGYEGNSNILDLKNLGKLIWKREDKSPEQVQLDILLKQISELNTQANKLQETINVKA
jgi:hypothetical protein